MCLLTHLLDPDHGLYFVHASVQLVEAVDVLLVIPQHLNALCVLGYGAGKDAKGWTAKRMPNMLPEPGLTQ